MMKRRTEIFLTGLLTVILMGCGENADPVSVSGRSGEESPEEDSIELPLEEGKKQKYMDVQGLNPRPGTHLALVLKDLSTPYWKAVQEGAEQAVEEINEELGYTGEEKVYATIDGVEGEGGDAVDAQINTLDAVLAENPAALCLAAIDMQSCEAQMETAAESEIPVVILDSGIESELVAASCMTDNRAAAAEAADRLCREIGEKGQVAVLSYSKRTATSQQRVQGFLQKIQKEYPQVEVMDILYEDEEQTAAELWDQLRETYPDLDGLFCTSSTVTVRVLERQGEESGPVIVSFDAEEEQLEAIRDGRLAGTICQNPRGMGYASVAAALRAAEKKPVDRKIDTGYQWIDQKVLEKKESEKYLYD